MAEHASPGVSVVVDEVFDHPEGLLWDARQGRLLWVDIFAGLVLSHDLASGAHPEVGNRSRRRRSGTAPGGRRPRLRRERRLRVPERTRRVLAGDRSTARPAVPADERWGRRCQRAFLGWHDVPGARGVPGRGHALLPRPGDIEGDRAVKWYRRFQRDRVEPGRSALLLHRQRSRARRCVPVRRR